MHISRRNFNLGFLVSAFSLIGGRPAAARAPTAAPMFDFAIAGGRYHGLEGSLLRLRLGDMLELRREPDNPHDANAVAVHGPDGSRLGYLPRRANPPVAKLMDEGRQLAAEIVGNLDFSDESRRDLKHTGFAVGDPRLRLFVRT